MSHFTKEQLTEIATVFGLTFVESLSVLDGYAMELCTY